MDRDAARGVQSHHEEAEIVLFSANSRRACRVSRDERREYLASAGVAEPGSTA